VLRRSLRGGQQPTATYQTTHFSVDVDQRTASQVTSQVASQVASRTVSSAAEADDLTADASSKDDSERQLTQDDREITPVQLELTPLEFDLLATFMSYPGRVWNRSQLIKKLWGEDFFGDERVVDTHVARLRKKIEPDPAAPTFIKTVVGVGYRFEDEA